MSRTIIHIKGPDDYPIDPSEHLLVKLRLINACQSVAALFNNKFNVTVHVEVSREPPVGQGEEN